MKKLLTFKAGLGDAAQFTIVLTHLAQQRPDWEIGVETLQGCEGLFPNGYALIKPFTWRDQKEQKQNVNFFRPEFSYAHLGVPSTKATRCILEEFHLQVDPSLYRYEMPMLTEEAKAKAQRYHEEELGGREFALIHYQGHASPEEKNLTETQANLLCDLALDFNYFPVILDWQQGNPIAKLNPTLCKNPNRLHPWLWDRQREGNAQTITALIERASVFFGIDSGPAHLAAATETPTFVFWTGHHPSRCFDPAPNVVHCLHHWARDTINGEELAFFEANYRWHYFGNDLTEYLDAMLIPDDQNGDDVFRDPADLDNVMKNEGQGDR